MTFERKPTYSCLHHDIVFAEVAAGLVNNCEFSYLAFVIVEWEARLGLDAVVLFAKCSLCKDK